MNNFIGLSKGFNLKSISEPRKDSDKIMLMKRSLKKNCTDLI